MMLQEAINLQHKAVSLLLKQVELGGKQITFKAPTGAGKTYIIAKFMDEFLAKQSDAIFIVSSLSKAKLAEQNHNKFNDFVKRGFVKNLLPYLINSETSGENALYIPVSSNVYSLPRDLYKDKSKLKNQRALEKFLLELAPYRKIYLIKDECHIATSNLDELVNKNYFEMVINISATPKEKPDVEICEAEAVNTKLIKSVQYMDKVDSNYYAFEIGDLQYDQLAEALQKFIKLKVQYQQLNINPCFIIQISNKDLGEQQFNVIKHLLNSQTFKDLQWMSIAQKENLCDTNNMLIKANRNKWEKYVVHNESLIDVLIFKMMITEGWDIPRACMLFQIRDSKSKQLDEQVLGRIRRNPRLLDFDKLSDIDQKRITTAYVWGMKPKSVAEQNIEVKLKDCGCNSDDDSFTLIQNQQLRDEFKIKISKLKNLQVIDRNFNVKDFLSQQEQPLANKSIFALYDDLRHANTKVQNTCWEFVENTSVSLSNKYADWFSFVNNLSPIQNKIKTILQSYSSSIECVKDKNGDVKEVSFPLQSVYIKNNNYQLTIGEWIWKIDNDLQNFTFDSEAERKWINWLLTRCKKNIKRVNDILLIGKNYLPNSEIRYQYYDNGLHDSYPDFIMKTVKDEYFIFEVKSANISNKIVGLDSNAYTEKVNALKIFYCELSAVISDYYFCIPIQQGADWNINYYKNGQAELLTLEDFKNRLDQLCK